MNFNFITERIAVGQKIDTEAFCDALRLAGITHVINLFSGNPEPIWKDEVLTLAQEDDGSPRCKYQVQMMIDYGLSALAKRGKLYIHCQWGLGRVPTACYAILRSIGFTETEAVERIETRRPQCATWSWKQYIPSVEAAL